MAQERAAVRFTAIVSKCEWVPASVERRRVATVVTNDRVTLRWIARALGALLLFGASPGPVSAQTPPRTHAPDADDDDEEDSAADDAPGLSPAEITAVSGIDQATVCRHLKTLRRDGRIAWIPYDMGSIRTTRRPYHDAE